jgi:hypothetical protein
MTYIAAISSQYCSNCLQEYFSQVNRSSAEIWTRNLPNTGQVNEVQRIRYSSSQLKAVFSSSKPQKVWFNLQYGPIMYCTLHFGT